MLSRIERIVLTYARELLDTRQERYICCAIDFAVWKKRHELFSEPAERAHYIRYRSVDCARALQNCILRKIDEIGDFEIWLYKKTGIRTNAAYYEEYDSDRPDIVLEEVAFLTLANQCRVAWLDRILETGSIN